MQQLHLTPGEQNPQHGDGCIEHGERHCRGRRVSSRARGRGSAPRPFHRGPVVPAGGANVSIQDISQPVAASKTALVVEDNEAIRYLLERICEMQGYEVASGNDGASALHALSSLRRPPEVLIIDYNVPHTDTLGVVDLVRAKAPNVAVLFTSGLPLESLPKRVATFQFLPKPFNVAAVSNRLRSLLADTYH